MGTNISVELSASISRVFSTQKVKVEDSSETLVPIYQIALHCILEDHNPYGLFVRAVWLENLASFSLQMKRTLECRGSSTQNYIKPCVLRQMIVKKLRYLSCIINGSLLYVSSTTIMSCHISINKKYVSVTFENQIKQILKRRQLYHVKYWKFK
jgi:hypothetical protein